MIKRILSNWHRYVFWAVISGIFVAWLFSVVTEKPASKKVVLFAELPAIDGTPLEIALEEDKPDAIAYVQAALFEYAMIDQTEALNGDLYIFPEPHAEAFIESFQPIDRSAFPGATFLEIDGKAYGILVSDPAVQFGLGSAYITYYEDVRCYLCFNKDSLHLGAWNGSADNAAIGIAQRFLSLD
jgi:hypothetical protein